MAGSIEMSYGRTLRPNKKGLCLVLKLSGSTTISTIARKVCIHSEAVLNDILELPANKDVINSLWENNVRKNLDDIEQKAEENEWFPLFKSNVSDEYSEEKETPEGTYSRQKYQIRLAIALGADYDNWGFEASRLFLRNPFPYSTDWKKCRESNSVASLQPKSKLDAYREAVRKLLPYLKKLEKAIESYDRESKKWMESPNGGESALKALGLLNIAERITDIYSRQDRNVGVINSMFQELSEHAANKLKDDILFRMRDSLEKMEAIAYDAALNDSLLHYLLLYNPSDSYYWHTEIANTVPGVKSSNKTKRFDHRLFKAVSQFSEYLSASDRATERAAHEANTTISDIHKSVLKLAKENKLDAGNTLDMIHKEAWAKYKELKQNQDVGLITTFSIYSGYMCTCAGNFEGPPSVLSIMLTACSKNDRFMTNIHKGTFMKAFFLMIGVDSKERHLIESLINRGMKQSLAGDLQAAKHNLLTAKELYINSAWRSRSVFTVYTLFGLFILTDHLFELADKYPDDAEEFRSEFIKVILLVVADVANLGLTYLTIRYSTLMHEFFKENTGITTRSLSAKIAELEGKGGASWKTPAGRRVIGVRIFHRTMASIGFVLSVWDAADNWHDSDDFQATLQILCVGASLMCLLGTFLCASWLGPTGFIIGVILVAGRLTWDAFLSGIDTTLRELLAQFKKNKYYESVLKDRDAEGWQVLWFIRKTYEDLVEETLDEIHEYSWKKLDEQYMRNYFLAGLNIHMLGKIYEKEDNLSEIRSILSNQRVRKAREEKLKKRHLELVVRSPASGVPLYLNVVTHVEVALYNVHKDQKSPQLVYLDTRPVESQYVSCWSQDPDLYLGGYFSEQERGPAGDRIKIRNSYDPATKRVVLRKYRRDKTMILYRGTMKLFKMPKGREAQFLVKVRGFVALLPVSFSVKSS